MDNVKCTKEVFAKYYDRPEVIQDMKKIVKYLYSHFMEFRNSVLNPDTGEVD